MTPVRKCDSPQGGVKGIRKVCQFVVHYDGYVGGKRDMTAVKKSNCAVSRSTPTRYRTSMHIDRSPY